jgi:molybdopterin converting factor small subunit
MPQIRFKIHSWLAQGPERDASSFKEGLLCVPEDESLDQILSRLTVQEDAFLSAKATPPEDRLIIINGRIVQPIEFSSIRLQEGDEIALFPLLSGG